MKTDKNTIEWTQKMFAHELMYKPKFAAIAVGYAP